MDDMDRVDDMDEADGAGGSAACFVLTITGLRVVFRANSGKGGLDAGGISPMLDLFHALD